MKHQAIGQQGNPGAVLMDEVSGQGIALLGMWYVNLVTGQGREALRGFCGPVHALIVLAWSASNKAHLRPQKV